MWLSCEGCITIPVLIIMHGILYVPPIIPNGRYNVERN